MHDWLTMILGQHLVCRRWEQYLERPPPSFSTNKLRVYRIHLQSNIMSSSSSIMIMLLIINMAMLLIINMQERDIKSIILTIIAPAFASSTWQPEIEMFSSNKCSRQAYSNFQPWQTSWEAVGLVGWLVGCKLLIRPERSYTSYAFANTSQHLSFTIFIIVHHFDEQNKYIYHRHSLSQ